MPERRERIFSHLKRFIVKRPEREKLAQELLEEDVSKAEIFQKVSRGLGRGKSHASGKPDGELKGT